LRGDCVAIAWRLRGDCEAIALRLHDDFTELTAYATL
jgi:hypothetical protein